MSVFNQNNTALRICIDRVEDRRVSGRVVSQRLTGPMEFTDLGTLVLSLEDIFDHQKFPQAFQRSRMVLRSDSDLSIAAADPESGMPRDAVQSARGAVTTIEVNVTSRRSSSWQGSVDWMDGSERREFVSYLELMRMVVEHFFSESN